MKKGIRPDLGNTHLSRKTEIIAPDDIVRLHSSGKRRPLELTLQETSLRLSDKARIIRSSDGYAWPDIAAFLIHEQPTSITHHAAPNLWLTTVYNILGHQRVMDGQTIHESFDPQRIMITPPNLATEDTFFDAGIMLHIFLRQEVLAEVAEGFFEKNLQDMKIRPELRAIDPALLHLMQATEYLLHHPFGSNLQSDYIARTIAVQILKNHSETIPDPLSARPETGMSPGQIKKVNDFMLDHLGEDFRLAELASITGLSRTAFFERFKRSMKRTPHQHLQIMRVKRAQELLSRGSLPLAEVAFTCGFADQTHLTRVFRQYVGTTPGQYRKNTRRDKTYQVKTKQLPNSGRSDKEKPDLPE